MREWGASYKKSVSRED